MYNVSCLNRKLCIRRIIYWYFFIFIIWTVNFNIIFFSFRIFKLDWLIWTVYYNQCFSLYLFKFCYDRIYTWLSWIKIMEFKRVIDYYIKVKLCRLTSLLYINKSIKAEYISGGCIFLKNKIMGMLKGGGVTG